MHFILITHGLCTILYQNQNIILSSQSYNYIMLSCQNLSIQNEVHEYSYISQYVEISQLDKIDFDKIM